MPEISDEKKKAGNVFSRRMESLAKRLSEKGPDAFLITTGDFHGSEYTAPFFHTLSYFSGFTGSNGKLLIFRKDAGENEAGRPGALLWTDGRYFLQAQKELAGSGIGLMKEGTAGILSLRDYIAELAAGAASQGKRFSLGFDGRCLSASEILSLRETFEKKGGKKDGLVFLTGEDLAGELWERDPDTSRPALSANPVFALEEEYTGKSRSEKLKELAKILEEKEAGALVLSAPDQIAWLFNLRGSDIAYNPVFYAYAIVMKNRARLYLMTEEYPESLTTDPDFPVTVLRYERFERDLKALRRGRSRIWADPGGISYGVYAALERIAGSDRILSETSPLILQKAVKNETEIAGAIRAHLLDGAAVTKWIFQIKKMEKAAEEMSEDFETLTELGAADLLEKFRCLNPEYKGPSFAPILAFRENGAIVHYEPTPETDRQIEFTKGDYLLADTGGQYLFGTTDITRTLSLGEPTQKQKLLYTAVLAGHLNLLDAVFLKGAPGSSLDQLAREPLYRLGYDYRHGTGHGVGSYLCVHEGPNAFRMKYTKENVILPGMITSDEPGVYPEGEFGIRLESLILADPCRKTEYGEFLHFRPLTMVPFDRESILPGELTDRQLLVLNRYHEMVYENLASCLDAEERAWLQAVTAPIVKED